jgi:hypothetical protein
VLGLRFINRARKAKSYSRRERILKKNFGTHSPFFFLQDALQYLNRLGPGLTTEAFTTPLSGYDSKLLATVRLSPSAHEPDPGPDEVWRAKHYESIREEFVMGSRHRYLRERGYVFWDHDRLAGWDLLTVRWESDLWVGEHRPDRHEEEEQDRSIQARKLIYRQEGRGWWSKDNESKVVYPDFEKRAREREARKQAKREEERAYYRWLQKKGMRPMGPEIVD